MFKNSGRSINYCRISLGNQRIFNKTQQNALIPLKENEITRNNRPNHRLNMFSNRPIIIIPDS